MDLTRFDLNLLRVFEALHVQRNASLAAEALGLTQPAVSNALRRLRRETGDELFTRTPQGMAPTPRAERLAGSIAQALATLREGRHAVVAAQGTGHGIVEAIFECAGIEPDVRVRLPHFLSVPMLIAQTDLVVTVPQRLGYAFAKILPLRLLPHPLKIAPFQVNQYWHRRFHQDPANQWLRGNFTRLLRP